MNYGKALKIIRSSRNISQKKLGESVNLNPSYISLIEKNKRTPTIETLENIVNFLDVPVHLFFLLASDKDEVRKVSSNKKSDVAELLLDILLSAEKGK